MAAAQISNIRLKGTETTGLVTQSSYNTIERTRSAAASNNLFSGLPHYRNSYSFESLCFSFKMICFVAA
jgi:hypothetical protein